MDHSYLQFQGTYWDHKCMFTSKCALVSKLESDWTPDSSYLCLDHFMEAINQLGCGYMVGSDHGLRCTQITTCSMSCEQDALCVHGWDRTDWTWIHGIGCALGIRRKMRPLAPGRLSDGQLLACSLTAIFIGLGYSINPTYVPFSMLPLGYTADITWNWFDQRLLVSMESLDKLFKLQEGSVIPVAGYQLRMHRQSQWWWVQCDHLCLWSTMPRTAIGFSAGILLASGPFDHITYTYSA